MSKRSRRPDKSSVFVATLLAFVFGLGIWAVVLQVVVSIFKAVFG